jgi:hypothetical protein
MRHIVVLPIDSGDPSNSHRLSPRADKATPEIQKHLERLAKLQYLLYADGVNDLPKLPPLG